MMQKQRYVIAAAAVAAVCLIVGLIAAHRSKPTPRTAYGEPVTSAAGTISADGGGSAERATTTIYAHNLELRKGPDFRIYIRWLHGEMRPTQGRAVPSLDDEASFLFHIDRGLIHANLGDNDAYFNSKIAPRLPLRNTMLRGEGSQIKLTGTLHKLLVPLPVEIVGTLAPAPGERVHLQVVKINVLKVPMKGLLGGFKVDIGDIIGKEPVDGVEVQGNDIYLDTMKLLPPPHVRGQITNIALKAPDIVVTYGSTTPEDETELAKWHNFLRLRGGSVAFGKLTMNQADLTLIDASDDAWFDLDIANYQQQIVKGYTRITPTKGLEIFMPDVGKGMPPGAVSLDTLRDRSKPLPATPTQTQKPTPTK